MIVCVSQPSSCGLDNSFYLWVPVHFHICKISRSHGIFYIQWDLWRPMEYFMSWIFYVSEHAQYYTTYQVTIVTWFPYIVNFSYAREMFKSIIKVVQCLTTPVLFLWQINSATWSNFGANVGVFRYIPGANVPQRTTIFSVNIYEIIDL